MTYLLKKISLFFAALLLAACAAAPRDTKVNITPDNSLRVLSLGAQTQASIEGLSRAIMRLSSSVNREQAQALATEAHFYALYLADVWQVESHPLLHNISRNKGEKEFGLCYDWTFALRERLGRLTPPSLQWQWGMANEHAFNEHSAAVLMSKGGAFSEGIIIDGWRNSGMLYWVTVKNDPKYQWTAYLEPPGWIPQRVK